MQNYSHGERVIVEKYSFIHSQHAGSTQALRYDRLLRTVDKQPLAMSLLELLLASLAIAATKDQLAPELPVKRDAPLLCCTLVDDRVVVLEVGTEAFGFKRNPESVLVHGVAVLRPVAEVLCVGRKPFAEVVDGLGVFVEEDLRSIA